MNTVQYIQQLNFYTYQSSLAWLVNDCNSKTHQQLFATELYV